MVNYRIWIGGMFHMSGGVRALHVLRDELRDRGLQATMTYEDPARDGIMIYPEIVPNNHENVEKIVRWKLNRAVLPDDGLTFAWETGMGAHPLLTVDIVERTLWTPWSGPRSGVAYWVGKGTFDPTVVPAGAVEISRDNYGTREVLAERIRSLDYLISFDPFTAVILEATCAGTPVVIHAPNHAWTMEDVTGHGWFPYGVAWGIGELGYAKDTVGKAFEHYEGMRGVFQNRIDGFVEVTQRRFA
jgi:hypothetical protein